MGKDTESAVIINVLDGGQLNVACDNSNINATQDNVQDLQREELYDNKKMIQRVENLIKRGEYEKAKDILFEIETNNQSVGEKFIKDLYLGKCYICLAQNLKENKESERNKKKNLLQEGLCCLKDAQNDWQGQKEEYIYDFYILYINACIQLGELEGESDYYKLGIALYNEGILDTKIKDFNDPKRYRLLLDYALLLDGASKYSKGEEAKKYLIEESECYFIIGTLEELTNKGIDEESAYRYFVNAGRCFEQLLEFTEEDFDELANDTIEFYSNALDSRLVSLNKYPDRYGLVNNNLGNIYSRLFSIRKRATDFEMAKECYEKALTAYKNLNNKEKYYQSLSNKARLLLSSYKENGTENDFEEIKGLLEYIIKKRKKNKNFDGVYLSKIHLAELYFYGGEKNLDINKLSMAISIYNEVLEFYINEYIPDRYYKALYGKYKASCCLADMQHDVKMLEKLLKEVLDLVTQKRKELLDDLIQLYADLVKNIFLAFVECDEYGEDKLEELYNKINNVFIELNLKIEDYIIKEK